MSGEVLIDRLWAVAQARAEHPAVIHEGVEVSYRTLFERAAFLAQSLIDRGLGPGRIVALGLEKSPDYLSALLGTWLAGAAFVPLGPELPLVRRRTIVRETQAALLIGGDGSAEVDGIPTWTFTGARLAQRPTCPPIDPEALAYVIYTSGSSGRPKGIKVSHRGLLPLIEHQVAAFRVSEESRALFSLSTAFDASISDLGTTLFAGGALVIEPPARLVPGGALGPTLQARRVTHWDLPPALLPHLEDADLPPSLQTLIIGGEPADPAAVRRWAERLRVVNVYGPTEATICTSLCVCDRTWSAPLLGEPIPGVSYRVVDEDGVDGARGELWIAGPGLALGYLEQPELEAARFITQSGVRWYRTGDRVRKAEDGRLVFLGRSDRQLKIDGVLVAPEELERVLLTHPAVGGVVVGKDLQGELTAWIEPKAQGPAPEASALRQHLALQLPPRLRPRRLVILASLPRLVSGKVDHGRLVHLGDQTAPAAPNGASIVQDPWSWAWAQVLGCWPGPEDDLADLGADSLRALRTAAILAAEGIVVSPPLLMAHRTVAAQRAAFLALGGAPDEGRSTVELIADLEGVPIPEPSVTPGRAPMRQVLLTGATGFLGVQVLVRLLQDPTKVIRCLVRAKDRTTALARIEAAAARQGLLLPRPPDQLFLGDLERPRLGLEGHELQVVLEETDTLLHLAGAVSLTAPYEVLRPANVGGTAELLGLLSRGRAKHLHFASTLSVFVGSDVPPGRIGPEAPLALARTLYGGYAQSKWAAEYLLRRTPALEGAITIYRLGLLVGALGAPQLPERDLLAITILGLAELGAAPQGLELHFDLTPVDHAAQVVSVIAEATGPTPRTLNVCSARGASFGELLAAFERARAPLELLPQETWRARAQAQIQEGASVEASTAYWLICRAAEARRFGAFDLFQSTGFTFDAAETERTTGRSCPPIGAEGLERYVRACLASGRPSPQTRRPSRIV